MNWSILWVALLPAMVALESGASIGGSAMCSANNPNPKNVLVFLTGSQVVATKPPESSVILDQHRLRFDPHVLAIIRGTTVAFPNSDKVRHNIFSPSIIKMFNLGIYSFGMTRSMTFDKAGVAELLCNVHPEMSAYILVLETPYFSTTDEQGFFQVPDVGPGSYTLNFWCEHLGFLSRELVLDSGQSLEIHAVLHAGQVTLDGQDFSLSQEERDP